MSKDFEYLTKSSESMVYLVMIRLMLKRLAKGAEVTREKGRVRAGLYEMHASLAYSYLLNDFH